MLAILGAKLSLDLLEVQRRKIGTWPAVDSGLVPDDLGAEGLWEAADGLAEVALEELDDGGGEVECIGTLEDILLCDLVGCHPLREVTDHLRRRRDLDDVTALDTLH